jgi:hypothetical protein
MAIGKDNTTTLNETRSSGNGYFLKMFTSNWRKKEEQLINTYKAY